MSLIQPALDRLCAEISARTAEVGRRVDPAALGVLDRAGHLPLRPPGRVSPGGACRLVRAADGWIAVNLAREDDRDLLPAWLEAEVAADPWPEVERLAALRPASVLIARAGLLGLPVSRLGEASAGDPPVRAGASNARRGPALKVVDLSALWAGPLSGAILAAMGAEVTRVESERRLDPTRDHTPAFFDALNGAKRSVRLDLAAPHGQARLRDLIASADVLITSCRRRALPSLGLDESEVLAGSPGLVWVAITGHGWDEDRVAFGDDAAVAGGLVGWDGDAPRFLGDALADPVTGLSAAAAALRALPAGGGLIDVAMSKAAAQAAKICGLGVGPPVAA